MSVNNILKHIVISFSITTLQLNQIPLTQQLEDNFNKSYVIGILCGLKLTIQIEI